MAGRQAPDRKILLVILDGLGDLPSPLLGGDTPLEAAATPHLDAWVAAGLCGLVDPVEPGTTVETHAGTGTLMGLSTDQATSLDRGPIEAAGAGMDLVAGDVALRCNFATLALEGGELAVQDRRAGRILTGMEELAVAVNGIAPVDGITTFLQPLSQHRAVVRLSGPGLSAAISDTDPGDAGPQTVRASRALQAGDESAERTAAALNRFLRAAHDVLHGHPVNAQRSARGLLPASGLLTRGAGMVQPVLGLVERLGLRGAVVAGDRTVLGLGSLLGFRPVVDAAFTALLDTDLDRKIAVVKGTLAEHDIVWLHVKGPDIAAHDKQPEAKRDFLERLDTAMAGLRDLDIVLGVAADHTTDSNTGRHASDPVPALVHVPGGRRDDCTSFGERACMRGGLGRLRAAEYLRVLLSAAGAEVEPPRPPDADPSSDVDDALPDAAPSREE